MELTDVAIGVTTIDKFEEPLDEAGLHLPFTARDYEYEMRGLLSIYVDDGTDDLQFDYLILSDEVTPGSKYGEWKHDLSVMEYTHKLDMYLIHSLVKTKSILNDVPAPIEIIAGNGFNNSALTDESAYVRANFEPLYINEAYLTDTDIVIPLVREVYQVSSLVEWSDTIESEAYITVKDLDDAVIVAQHEISASSKTFQLDAGSYYIEYGFNATAIGGGTSSGYTGIYKYYFNVFEREDNSVYALVNLVRDVISKFGGIESKLNYADTRIFDIDPTIVDELKAIEAPQTFIQKATARQVLNGIFQYINAISRLRYQEDDNDLLTIDRFNETSGEFTLEDLSHYSSRQDAQNLANKGINWLEQVLPNNLEEPTLKTPSEDNFKTVRSTNIQIKEDQFELKLERPIYQLKRFTTSLGTVTYTFGDIIETIDLDYDDFELDLTSRLVNKEEWDLKLTTVNFPTVDTQVFWDTDIGLRSNKISNLYWRQGDTSIKLADPYGDVVQENLVYNVIEEALYEHFMRFPPSPEFNATDQMAELNTLTFTIPDFKDLRFNVEYITLENLNAQVEREDISYSGYYTEARINQSSKLLNVVNATRKSYGELQRSGVPNITFSRHHENIADILDVGYKNDDGYVVVQRKVEWQNNYAYATYNATKDHNRLSQFIGLDQAYRWAEIPTSNQVYECIESYTDYIVISDPSTTITPDTTKLYTKALTLMFGTLMNDWGSTSGKTKVTLAYVRTDGFLDIYPNDGTYNYGIMTPVASFGVKGGFVFNFGFENNQVAGVRVTESTNGGSTLYWNDA
ncbi:MAG: hypothetical protein EOL90_12345, partial [Spartobacteria bacterium]|nr:hypothetical protein [Spartobacteria bacterium]